MFACLGFFFMGLVFGLFLAGLIGVAYSSEYQQDLIAAYCSGFKAGQKYPFPPEVDS